MLLTAPTCLAISVHISKNDVSSLVHSNAFFLNGDLVLLPLVAGILAIYSSFKRTAAASVATSMSPLCTYSSSVLALLPTVPCMVSLFTHYSLKLPTTS